MRTTVEAEAGARAVDSTGAGGEFARILRARVTGFTAVPEYRIPGEAELMAKRAISLEDYERDARRQAENTLQRIAERARAPDGKQVYSSACAVCHNALPPKLGDKAAWEPRIKQGVDAMVASVIKGKGTMPPKAGKPSLTDAEIRAAVEYMMERAR